MKLMLEKNLWLPVLASAVVLSLSACGGGGSASDAAAAPADNGGGVVVAPVPVVTVQSVKLAAGDGYSLAVASTSTVHAWGAGLLGQVPSSASMVAVGSARWGEGRSASWAIQTNGGLLFWGADATGALATQAVALSGLGSVAAARACGAGNSAMLYILKTDGSVWAAPARSLSAATKGFAVTGVGEAKALGDSSDASCSSMVAIAKNGSVWQLQASHPLDASAVPTQAQGVVVAGLTEVVQASCAADNCLAVTNSGAVKAWGTNDKGQLGDGSQLAQSTPVDVAIPAAAGGVSKVWVSAGGAAYAIGKNLALYGWGQLDWGYRGVSAGLTLSPIQLLSALFEVVDLTVSPVASGQTLVALRNGSVVGWGGNASGELSSGLAQVRSPDPVEVSGVQLK